MSVQSVLVGDIGGTNTRFAVIYQSETQNDVTQFWTAPNDNYSSFDQVFDQYIHAIDHLPEKAVIAVAGPVKNNTVTLTNRQWTIEAKALENEFSLKSVRLVNDFAAMARSVPALNEAQKQVIVSNPINPNAPITVAGAGTGFGLATLVPSGNNWIVVSGEGGHQSYTPKTLLEIELMQTLQSEYSHVSTEIVVGGKFYPAVLKALYDIYGQRRQEVSPKEALERAAQGDEICLTLCELRARAIMMACGDAVLATGSAGGLVLAGGVTEHLMPYINTPEALSCFLQKDPMTPFMESINISLIKCDTAPLIGASFLAI